MAQSDMPITPSTKVGDLLEEFPELEDVLIGMAPPFRKLKNPVLRSSVAKVASLRQAAAVARLPVDEMVNRLRSTVGQVEITLEDAGSDTDYFTEQPDWVNLERVVATVDERERANDDEMPLTRVMHKATRLEEGDLLELITTFLPAPGIDLMKAKGLQVWAVEAAPGVIRTYIGRDNRKH